MIHHGARPSTLDQRDYSFHKTFPQFGAFMPAELPLVEYSLDPGLTMPDQNADGLPFACTGYAQGDSKTTQEKEIYDNALIYRNTCRMEGHGEDQGCNIRTSARSLRVYGAKRLRDGVVVRSGQTFNVDKAPGRDWFDSYRIALRAQKFTNQNTPISTGTIWFPEWASPPQNGLLTSEFTYDGNPYHYNWHNYNCTGEKIIDGEPTIEVKSWQGKNVGMVHMDRETFNKAFDIYGTIGITTAKANPEDVQVIKLDMLQTILTYLNRMLALIGHQIPIHA